MRSLQDTLSGDRSSFQDLQPHGVLSPYPRCYFILPSTTAPPSTTGTQSSLLLHTKLWSEGLLYSALHAMSSRLPDPLCLCPMAGVPWLTGRALQKHLYVRCSVGQEPGPYCPHLACLCYPLLWGLRSPGIFPSKPWPQPTRRERSKSTYTSLWKWCLLEVWNVHKGQDSQVNTLNTQPCAAR